MADLVSTGGNEKLAALTLKYPGAVNAPVKQRAFGEFTNLISRAAITGNALWGTNYASTMLLLAWKADPNVPDSLGRRPLMVAAGRGNLDMVRILLRYGADQKLTDARGKTPTDYAREEAREDVAKCLEEQRK